jgi:hypothetical protein
MSSSSTTPAKLMPGGTRPSSALSTGAPAAANGSRGAGAPGGAPGSGRLRSDFTRPPSAGPGRTPLRSGKDGLAGNGGGGGGGGANGIPAAAYDALSPAYAHSNALYGLEDGAGMTANLRGRDYAPPTQQQHYSGGGGADAAAPLSAGAPLLARKLGAPCPALHTHGDLWVGGDQDDDREPVVLEVRAPTQASRAIDVALLAAGNGGGAAAAAAAAAAAPAPAAAIAPQSAPMVLPAWLRTRPFSTCLHLAGAAGPLLDAEAEGEPAPDLRALPEAVREAALVDDLLYCFMGVPGRAIRPALVDGQRYVDGPALAFSPAAALDERSAELVRKLLPLAEYAAVVERFAVSRDSPERGMVVEALASEMRSLLEKWRLLVVQLERRALGPGGLSLSELLFQCQAPMASLKLAAEIAVGGGCCMRPAAFAHVTSSIVLLSIVLLINSHPILAPTQNPGRGVVAGADLRRPPQPAAPPPGRARRRRRRPRSRGAAAGGGGRALL